MHQFSQLKKIMRDKAPFNDNMYWSIDNSKVKSGCDHNSCGCVVEVRGKDLLPGYTYTLHLNKHEQGLIEWVTDFAQKNYVPTHLLTPSMLAAKTYFYSRVRKGSNIQLIPAETTYNPPIEEKYFDVHPDLHVIAKVADMTYFKEKGVDLPREYWEREIWNGTSMLTLRDMCLRKLSIYNMTYGKPQGIPNFVDSMSNLYPTKLADAALKDQRDNHKPPEAFEELWKDIEEVESIMDEMMGVKEYLGRFQIGITYQGLQDSFQGSAGGIDDGPTFKKRLDESSYLHVRPNEKKYEKFKHDLHMVDDFIERGEEFAVRWNRWPKSETKYVPYDSVTVQRQEVFDNEKMKLRMFVYPNSAYFRLETIMFTDLFRLERKQGPIIIGLSWARGGMDVVAGKLRVTMINENKIQFVDGDISGFDHGVFRKLIYWFYQRAQRYEDPRNVFFAIRSRILEFLKKNMINRITHIVFGIWAVIMGCVPSGSFVTSQIDTLVNLLYLTFFFVWSIKRAPENQRDRLYELLLNVLGLVLYGDDFVYNATDDEQFRTLLSPQNYVHFMLVYFRVVVRDCDVRPFLSSHSNGWLIIRGTIVLRHRAVLNPWGHKPKQPRYLPFRPLSEYVQRAIIGKDNRDKRGAVDVALSSLGHAYGTYGSNEEAYLCLKHIHQAALAIMGETSQRQMFEAVNIMGIDSIRDFRRRGISEDEIRSGFPTLNYLREKNEFDAVYHSRGTQGWI